jgi:phosphinothricin acetyltransferase
MNDQTEKINIRSVLSIDAEVIGRIYNHYITQTFITFEEEEVSTAEINRRIQDVQLSSLPWLVTESDGTVVGYAYADKWKGRYAYRFSAEVTVYIDPDYVGHGIGSKLYSRLLPTLVDSGIHVAIGGIALPNQASVGLHEKFGFIKTAHFKEVGYKFNRWIDVGYWQRIL